MSFDEHSVTLKTKGGELTVLVHQRVTIEGRGGRRATGELLEASFEGYRLALDGGGTARGRVDSVEKVWVDGAPRSVADGPTSIPRERIHRLARVRPPMSPVASSPSSFEPEPYRSDVVRLHVQTKRKGVTLFQVTGTAPVTNFISVGGQLQPTLTTVPTSSPVCVAPCDREVDGAEGQQFFFGGEGVTPSDPFYLYDKHGAVVANVDAGSTRARMGGLVTLPIGIVAVVLGGSMVAYAAAKPTARDVGEARAVAGIGLGVGVPLTILGGVLIGTSGTRVQLE